MEIKYIQCDKNVWRPYLPITYSYKSKSIPIGHSLADTGSDLTILPMSVAHELEIELDDTETRRIESAGGGVFKVMPSRKPITFTVRVTKGFRPITWSAIPFFTYEEQIPLLGNKGVLEHFDVTFFGPEKKLSVLPRFSLQ